MIDQALVGALLTGGLAIASQIVAKVRCYIGCKRDQEGEVCEPTCQVGFMDTTLDSMQRHTESPHEETPTP